MAENGTPDNDITAKHRRFISELINAKSVEQASTSAGISVRTGWRWMKSPVILAALRDEESRLIEAATRSLVGAATGAIDTLREIHADPNVAPGVRVRAAGEILARLLQLRELVTLEERLSRLETLQNEPH